jgi:hypothetical protein
MLGQQPAPAPSLNQADHGAGQKQQTKEEAHPGHNVPEVVQRARQRIRKLIDRLASDLSEQHNASNHKQPGTGSVSTQGDLRGVIVEGGAVRRHLV